MTREKSKQSALPDPPPGWPRPLGNAARHGLVGDILGTVEPHTEADTAALGAQLIQGFGSVVGSRPRFTVEADIHHTNLNVAVIGRSGRSRKGTSRGYIGRLLREVDRHWARESIQGGLSSGEGLVQAVAEGIPDHKWTGKRLLIVEDEFSGVLRTMSRYGNILSNMIRNAWDCRPLQVMTRQAPLRVSDAHISILANCTQHDLERYFNIADLFNGFANRFLWVCARRSKILAIGGGINERILAELSSELKDCVLFARKQEEVGLSKNATRLFVQQYPHLSRDIPGLVGAVTSRAEAQVRRIALIYALMDKSDTVRTRHLRAALEVWRYCEDSAGYLFAGTSAVTLEEKILVKLRQAENGLTRAEINRALGGHVTGSSLAKALDNLKEQKLARRKKASTGGRAAQIWSVRSAD